MSRFFWLPRPRTARLTLFCPKRHCKLRVDDGRLRGGTILVSRHGWRLRDAPGHRVRRSGAADFNRTIRQAERGAGLRRHLDRT